MYSAEDDDYVSCAACGAEVSIFDRVYAFEKHRALCFGCASERHGVYLDLLDRWTVAPHLEGLPEQSLPREEAGEAAPRVARRPSP